MYVFLTCFPFSSNFISIFFSYFAFFLFFRCRMTRSYICCYIFSEFLFLLALCPTQTTAYTQRFRSFSLFSLFFIFFRFSVYVLADWVDGWLCCCLFSTIFSSFTLFFLCCFVHLDIEVLYICGMYMQSMEYCGRDAHVCQQQPTICNNTKRTNNCTPASSTKRKNEKKCREENKPNKTTCKGTHMMNITHICGSYRIGKQYKQTELAQRRTKKIGFYFYIENTATAQKEEIFVRNNVKEKNV